MTPSDRRRMGAVLIGFGWLLSLAGVLVVAAAAVPFLLLGQTLSAFLVLLFLAASTIALGPVLVHWGDLLRHPPAEHSVCPHCGYDLRGGPDAGCPECGWARPGLR